MDLVKAKILLDKINRLYKSMSLDEDNIAAIEKDLMRDYIKQLYETFLTEAENTAPKSGKSTAVPKWTPPVRETPPPTPIIHKKVAVKTPPPPPPVVEETPVIQAPPPPPPVVEEVPVVKTPPPPPPVEATKPVYTPPPRPKTALPTYTVDPEHEELFQINLNAKELSEKLGQTRIPDLNNAMGLNERIFTVNELFGADNSLYRNVIRELNSFSSFDQAKAYLSANVAEKFNWTHKSKRNKAKNFIKLVRRRYL